MNSIATSTLPKSIVTRRVVSVLLVAMLVITAIAIMFGDRAAILNSGGLLTLLWPMATIALASYWLREFLAERDYFDADIKIQSHLSSTGLFMAPVFLAQR